MDKMQTNVTPKGSALTTVLKLVCFLVGLTLTGVMLWNLFSNLNNSAEEVSSDPVASQPAELALMDEYDDFIEAVMTESYEAATSIKKVFWINDDVKIPPVPDAAKYGQTDDPSSLQWLLDEAAEILDGQELTFSTDVEIYPGSQVHYYLDDSILVITWKALYYDFVYTFSEVKVSHPSQVRRFIAEETYGSNYLYETSTMATMVNAVTAISGDYYRARNYGIVVYDGVAHQASAGQHVDTCYVDVNGDFHFTYRGEIMDLEAAQKFVDENDIEFSLAFGPVLVDNGVRCEHPSYALGEVNDEYPRAGICQKDKLHYILVTANWEGPYFHSPTIHVFAEVMESLDVQKAYTLDGGQTGTLVMDGKVINYLQSERQRRISDIIYFATAIPNRDEPQAETSE